VIVKVYFYAGFTALLLWALIGTGVIRVA